MSDSSGRWWHRYIPSYTGNPLKLAWQLFTDKNPAARSAMYMAAAGVAMAPLDAFFARKERQIYETSPDPTLPMLLVCGPPRSGTTLVAQYLINSLDVTYLNNLTSLFPKSPVHANRVFGRWIAKNVGDYEAFYGKSRGLAGANDALYIWDRWLGSNRDIVPKELRRNSGSQMRQFFGAIEQLYGLPIVNKANRLNTCAHLVAKHLPNARFVCVSRDPLFLAQSLYIARDTIMGDMGKPYGVQHQPTSDDPIEDVCLQVLFHEQQAKLQAELLGDRFSIVSYEKFCEQPRDLLKACRDSQPELNFRHGADPESTQFTVSRRIRLPEDVFNGLREGLQKKGVSISDY